LPVKGEQSTNLLVSTVVDWWTARWRRQAGPVSPFVFINYRNCDQPWAAVTLDRVLSRHFGDDLVFLASKSVPPGTMFDESLLAAVRHSTVLLVVIGDRWFATGGDGQRLIDRRQDWVRLEIATAFAAARTVIPVLVGDVPRLSPELVPADIRQLARCQSVRLRHHHCRQDLAHLVEVLRELLLCR
jgi:hypothetical protein